jgi:two-component system NarL family response regulator
MPQPKPIRVLVVDDHPAFRRGLIAIVNDHPSCEVVGEAATAQSAIAEAARHRPDVVLLDLRLPDMSGADATLALANVVPDARVIIVTTYECDEDIYRALHAGASSYLPKGMSAVEIHAAITSVHRGEKLLPASVAQRLADRLRRRELTAREIDVLSLIVQGRSNKEIAGHLGVADETVKSHLKNLFLKLGVHDRTQAAIAGLQHGIVHLG